MPFGRILRWTTAILVLLTGVLAPRYAPALLAEVEFFRATEIEVAGARYLAREEVIRLAGIGEETSIWDDLDPLGAAVETHPLVLSALARRELPDRIVFEVEEREPVGLVATPTLEAVDREGRYLPLDPSRLPLDLPLLLPLPDRPDSADRPNPVRLRRLAGIAELLRSETTFWSRVSVLYETPRGVVVRWGSPAVTFQLGRTTDLRRIQEGLAALGDAMGRSEDRVPRTVDLRWADQVVIRYHDS